MNKVSIPLIEYTNFKLQISSHKLELLMNHEKGDGKDGKSSRNNSIDGARNRHANLSETINIADTIQ